MRLTRSATDGLGSQKFRNLEEAKKVFPELDICTSSKIFTNILGSRLMAPIRFETWKAHEFYSN